MPATSIRALFVVILIGCGSRVAASAAPAVAILQFDTLDAANVEDAATEPDSQDATDASSLQPDEFQADVAPVPDVPPAPELRHVTWVGMPAPATPGERATAWSSAQVKLDWDDGSQQTQPLTWRLLFRTGDSIGGQVTAGLTDHAGTPLLDGTAQVFSDCPDGTTILPTSDGLLHMITHFEYVSHNLAGDGMYGTYLMTMGLTTLQQDAAGLLVAQAYTAIDMKPFGVWMPCAASRSPWHTHLGSEEYEPDARCVQEGNCAAQKKLGLQAADLWYGDKSTALAYDYGLLPEVTVQADGSTNTVKHRALGRLSREQIEVMPDQRTAYMGDDGAYTALAMFVADKAGDLSVGTLYAAKWQQKSAVAGGAAQLVWIRLGHGADAELAELAKTTDFKDIFAVAGAAKPGFQRVHTLQGEEWLQVKPGQETAAAFLETRRYAGLRGATTEFHKMEGVAHDPVGKALFVAMSYMQAGMQAEPGAAADHIKLPPGPTGAVYRCQMLGGQLDSDGQPIDSEWVAIDMTAWLTGKMQGEVAHPDTIANPDNLKVAAGWRTLFVGEDSGLHANNFLWAVDLDTGKIARIASVPSGAEVTGLFPFLFGGKGYLTVHFQHPGSNEPAVNALIGQLWGGGRQAGVGYLTGMPPIEP